MAKISSISNCFWEFCRISFPSIFEGVGVIVITGLEFRFGAPNIMFGGAIRCDRCFVNDSLFAACSIERIVRWVAAVARRDGGPCLLLVTELSCNREEFAKPPLRTISPWRTSGYHGGLAYDDHATDIRARRRNRKRNIVWFNSPFSKSVKNNIGKEFLNLVNKHFPPHHHLRKVCNRNTLKVSYSCMINMATTISSHDKNLLGEKQETRTTIPPCNCRNSANYPLNGACREKAVIYKASITSDRSSKHYIGCTETEFKTRYYNHIYSFKYRGKRNATELSKAIWNARDFGHEPVIEWSIADRATAYQSGSRSCNLCLTEKLAILLADKRTALNKRSELTGKCRHKNKYKLKNVRP